MPNLPEHIFRSYDIRGKVDSELNEEMIYRLGLAIGSKIKQAQETTVVVARDGRLSGPSLCLALTQGLLSAGMKVVELGELPTPVLYFATHYLNIPNGIMLTGSHNPANYNGLKIVIQGKSQFGSDIKALYHLLKTEGFEHGTGSLVENNTVASAYLQTIQNHLNLKNNLKKPLKIVIDAGNGVAGPLACQLYKNLGCEVIPLYCDIDGRFPNHHPDPADLKNLKVLRETVIQTQADLGLAFDGDGDRLGVIDSVGKVMWPDRLLILFARDLLKRQPNSEILFDVKCSRHVSNELQKLGGRPLMWKTGHSLIKAKMLETGALLAGEFSGHFFFKENWFGFDDGLYAGARLLELLSRENKSSAEWFKTVPDSESTPEIIWPILEEQKNILIQKLIACLKNDSTPFSTLDGLRIDFKDGFGLIRPSNTGPNMVLRFEGENNAALRRIQTFFRTLLFTVEPSVKLPF